MCGIVAVISRPSGRTAPSAADIVAGLDRAVAVARSSGTVRSRLIRAAQDVEAIDRVLRGGPGVQALIGQPELVAAIEGRLAELDSLAASVDADIDTVADEDLEDVNAALVQFKDALWALRNDRLRNAVAVADLAGRDASRSALAAFSSVQTALSALDRLEVRGRDSAGIHLLVRDHGLDLDSETVRHMLAGRADDILYPSGAVRVADGHLTFVYKAAAEIGELGDNTRVLRAALRADDLLHLAVENDAARVNVIAHTRWASVGIISEANAHPVIHEEETGSTGPYVAAALNGDVDNHADLKAANQLRIPLLVTTDAKVIPALVSRASDGGDFVDAFRRTVARFEGSVAIAAVCAALPDTVAVAVRGSGQGLYVGLAEDSYIVASEPYGLVEETSRYLRLDGETPAQPGVESSRGQIVVLDASVAGTLSGIRRLAYDGTELPVDEDEITTAEITTRDIDRGEYPHFLLKEITEAPRSFAKTLRGRIRRHEDGLLHAVLGERVLPADLSEKLATGAIRSVIVIGQGTAAVAGQSVADMFRHLLRGSDITIEATTATELSGFGMGRDLSDALVVAVSQSGTTTDTNRTVDLARARGATVVGIVNRRNSDLSEKANGILYTSDGRDVEMSVASTKAFYAQVAAGVLLACAVTEAMQLGTAEQRDRLLQSLRTLPAAMTEVLEQRPLIGDAARRFATARRYWAVVGNGPNRVAAEEVRIKLSELCYKSIACDITEDKKHIDLSCEPLILVCAAGLSGGTADDVAKEVAIYRAHKAAPIVIATEGEERFAAALQVIPVPATVTSELAFVLSAMVGHLFGYEAALAIDALALPFRAAREAVEVAISRARTGADVLSELRVSLEPVLEQFHDDLRIGNYDGQLEASTAVRVITLLRFATGQIPIDLFEALTGKPGAPDVVVDDLTAALTRAIEELTRPVDAIKHQAKTVTVGISRSDEGLLNNRLVTAVLAAGAGRDNIAYKTLKVLSVIDPAVAAVTGYTRYSVHGDPESDHATLQIVDRGGLARDLSSRVERNPLLRGTKRRVATERELLVSRGRSDGRTVILVPEVKGTQAVGITLLHVTFHDRLPAATARAVLQGYRDRYRVLSDFVTETETVFRDDLLADIDVAELLIGPLTMLAEHWLV
jgi:glutamine---fructose-6-phosphate transaminase (isomerizing)